MAAHRLALLLLLVLLLLACQPAPASPTATPGPVAVQSPVVITFWHPWNGPAARILDELALEYQRHHPGITIQVEERAVAFLRDEYRQAVLSGGSPDLVLLNSNRWIGDLADRRLLLPLNMLVPPEHLVKLEEQFYPFALEGSRYQDQLYALPVSFNVPVLFYNRANFPSRPPRDTDEWLTLARIELGHNPPRWGLAYNLTLDFILPYLPAFGGAILDDSGRLVLGTSGAEGTRQWLTWVRELRNRSRNGDILAVEDHQAIAQAVQSGRARLMVVDWASELPLYQSIWGGDVGVAPLPPLALPGRETPVPAVPLVHSEVLGINPRSGPDQQRVALDFMQWLTQPQQQRRLLEGTGRCPTCPLKLPVGRNVDLEPQPLSAEVITVAQDGRPVSPLPAMETSWPYIAEMVRAVLQDRLSAEEAVRQTAGQLCMLLRQPDCQ